MRAHWLDGVAVGALFALSIAATGLPNLAWAQQADPIAAAIPVPEPANVPPPTIADLDPPHISAPAVVATHSPPPTAAPATAPEQTAPQAEPADSTPTTTATIPNAPAAAEPAPAAPVVQAVTAPLDDAAILRAVPVPEPAQVAPPTARDIGTVQLSAADQAVADKLRELLATRSDRFVDGRKERAALDELYKARGYAPLFAEYGAPNNRMKAAIARLKAADADGLDASDYATPELKGLTDAEAMAQAELRLLNSLLLYARHAQAGRVTATRISPNMDFTPPVPEPADVLKTLAEAKDMAASLDAFNPPHPGFRALRAKLAQLQGSPDDRYTHIPGGPVLKLRSGKKAVPVKDARVPLLRERLHVAGDPADTTYDAALAEAVKAFQKSKGLSATGSLTQATVDALNGRSRGRDLHAIVSNMERWRWLPRDLGKAYVMVNVPDFSLKTVHDGKTVFQTRIVVGKPNTPSPQFSAAIENILVNPSWHVPQSIIYGEYLPALQQDPGVLARMGLQVSYNRDGSIAIKQPPGERNALGRIKFNFPNKYQVYLHDTPQKNLFAQDRRAYSHGCMRVQNPDKFAEVLLSIALPQERYTVERIKSMYGGGEQWLKFKKPIPVHLTYMNAYVDEHDQLVIRDDIYGYDGRVQAALRGQYMAIAERSQKVTPGAHRSAGRRVVQQEPQRPGFFLFPFFR